MSVSRSLPRLPLRLPLSVAQVPMPYAKNLETAAIPTADNIVSAARRACYRKPA